MVRQAEGEANARRRGMFVVKYLVELCIRMAMKIQRSTGYSRKQCGAGIPREPSLTAPVPRSQLRGCIFQGREVCANLLKLLSIILSCFVHQGYGRRLVQRDALRIDVQALGMHNY